MKVLHRKEFEINLTSSHISPINFNQKICDFATEIGPEDLVTINDCWTNNNLTRSVIVYYWKEIEDEED